MIPSVLAFGLALALALGLTPVARRVAGPLGFIDRPGPRKVHLEPTPLLGGLAIYAGAVLATLLSMDGTARGQVLAILAGATLLFLVGVLDDRKLLHPQVKLMVATPVAALLLLAAGVRASVFTPAGAWWGPAADAALTLVWVTGITGAFNILDHLDGLCAGIAAIAAACFLALAIQGGQVLVSVLAAAVLGSALGFLRWNFHPATIFMGDGGAVFLGFMLAVLGLKLRAAGAPPATAWMLPLLILGVPIFDTTLVTVSRTRRRLLPFAAAGKDHTAHRLVNLGLGHRGAVLLLYAFGGVSGGLALVVAYLSVSACYLLAGVVAAAGLGAIVALERAPFERQEKA